MKTYRAEEVNIGYHPDGYRIDKTASPMNLYTIWEILDDGEWINPKPTCFDSMPEVGWIKVEKFDWNDTD